MVVEAKYYVGDGADDGDEEGDGEGDFDADPGDEEAGEDVGDDFTCGGDHGVVVDVSLDIFHLEAY